MNEINHITDGARSSPHFRVCPSSGAKAGLTILDKVALKGCDYVELEQNHIVLTYKGAILDLERKET